MGSMGYMKYVARFLVAGLVAAAALAACGGGNDLTKGSSSGGTSSGGTTSLTMGNGTGSAFDPNVISIASKSLSAGGSTSIGVTIVDQTGALYTTSTTITFNSPCVGQNLASITVQQTPAAAAGTATITTTTGTASATYVASGCSGADVITATASANNQSLTANGTVTVAASEVGSIQFVSATPTNITLKGVGTTATSTVVFKVLNTAGGPNPNATVTFTANTNVGGLSITPATAVSDANGQVQTIVSGGTVATTVRITATTLAAGNSISTESSNLTISSGIPTSSNISLAVKCQNVEAFNTDGVTVPVTVRMTDRFSNPVPDGTTASFRTTLGGIQGTCQTATTGTESGVCTVNWVSKAPRVVNGNPQTTANNAYTNIAAGWCVGSPNSPGQQYCNGTTNGRSPLLVTAVGEESFVDANGNGVFDSGDTVAFDASDKDNVFANKAPKPWFDTSEPFLNEWEIFDAYGEPVWMNGEPYIDFNSNGMRDGPDGIFNGLLCGNSDASITPAPGEPLDPVTKKSLCPSSSAQSSVAISQSNIIILSGSTAHFAVTATQPVQTQSPFTIGSGLAIQMNIFDENYQQMPSGTTVTTSVVPATAGSVTSPAPAAWPCSSAAPTFDANGNVASAGLQYVFTLAPGSGTTTSGVFYITVTTPAGLITTYGIPLAD